jgi:hypothetical protein
MKLKYIAPILIAVACLGLQQVKADTTSFNLSAGNPAISGYTGPYASVLVNLTTSNTATITFTSLTNSVNIYLMGNGASMALNVNATTFTAGGVTFSQAGQTGFSLPVFTVNNFAGQNVDGFGSFNLTVDNVDGFAHAVNSISITLTNISGTWANAAAVLFANAQGALAASHIFVTLDPAVQSNGALATGYAANGGSVNAPDGGTTVMLLGVALGALGMARRFLRS